MIFFVFTDPCSAFACVCPVGCADRLSRRTIFPCFVFLFLVGSVTDGCLRCACGLAWLCVVRSVGRDFAQRACACASLDVVFPPMTNRGEHINFFLENGFLLIVCSSGRFYYKDFFFILSNALDLY